jgi:hypothetical protein
MARQSGIWTRLTVVGWCLSLATAMPAWVASCNSTASPGGDGSADHPSSVDVHDADAAASDSSDGGDASCGAIPAVNCLFTIARQGNLLYCGDVGVLKTCVGGQYVCPTGTVEERECTCSGPGSECRACASAGWQCPDGGDASAGDAADPSGADLGDGG